MVSNCLNNGKSLPNERHSVRVSCVRFSPNAMNPVIVSAGWDKVVKVRNFDHESCSH